eukprot:gnl/TRDRNA2_/TRDRNA2_169939_c0_seq3.p1 gnl/TRDRNA2_/TRDRNA2_169939_c0~~gnl/TRDRNA2_/TRDRNA2_169939_c0_seq3.p1  ORF type:complete len:246 (-),score=34.12 gnl/TRDRNA2_/TRDRNA2_169939_c0_seq3:114-851(-)
MLPIHIESERPSFAASASLSEYMRRMIQYAQMDIDYTFAQMLYLCLAPRKVYQLTSYRKQTKNQWARDDPAFIVVLVFFLVVAAICYSLAFQAAGTSALRILANFILVHFVAAGALISTCAWWLADKYLRVKSVHGMEQPIEWMYAFDIHCNSFFPLFLILYVVHFFLLPFLIQATLPATIVSNLLYAAALCYYTYITSLGYSTLPFLERTEVFLYPMAFVFMSTLVLCAMKINLTRLSILFLGI